MFIKKKPSRQKDSYPKDKDRRKHKRTNVKVRYKIVSGIDHSRKSRVVSGEGMDISIQGMGLEVSDMVIDGLHLSIDDSFGGLPVRNYLDLEVYLPTDDEPIRVKGQVEWYEKMPGGVSNKYRAGISFVDMPIESKERLEAFLKKYGS